ncbi:alpha/beta hydrolase [Planococcus sp. N064]|uniref:Alpha/beta hydrolase n=1 Tax=Planococcus liqunii TaxID=3058394 RepID=A0ABT8MM32_9BACL|nr:alpha/beta hydrolase [Planococcus sp. N064]MDN7225913.1 alpha/beta hydrolase [Planococcus sp. N064]
MKITKAYLATTDGQEIYYELYEPEAPVGHVHIVHGMAEHIARYGEFAQFLASHGFAVSGHDQRGHGRTAERNGVQGYFGEQKGFDRVVKDVEEVIAVVQNQIGPLPLILFGHSMGSFVTRRYIQLHSQDISRVVLSGSGGDPGSAGKAGLVAALMASKAKGKDQPSALLGKMTFGSFMKPFKDEESPFAWLSRDRNEVAKYEADPMCGFLSTNQFYVDLFTGLALIHKNAEVRKIRQDLPMLLISGSNDPVGGNGEGIFKAAKQYVEAGLSDVTVYLAEDARHELLHETDKEKHFETILEWMLVND